MTGLGASIGWGLLIGASLLAGAVVAAVAKLPDRVAALLTAFGGGILFAAVALELVPEADREAGVPLTVVGLLVGTLVYVGADAALNRNASRKAMRRSGHAAAAGGAMELPDDADAEATRGESIAVGLFVDGVPESLAVGLTVVGLLAGTLVYVGADAWLNRNASRKAVRRSSHAAAAGGAMNLPDEDAEATRGESIAVGLFVDGVPESLAVGLTIAEGEVGLALLGGVVVGNLVESYGAAQPIVAGGHSRRFAIGLLGGIGLVLALTTIIGATLLADASPAFIGTAQATAAGAVLAVVSISIVPHAFKEVSGAAAVATVLGFIVGFVLS